MNRFAVEKLESQQAYGWMDKLRKKRELDEDEEYEKDQDDA